MAFPLSSSGAELFLVLPQLTKSARFDCTQVAMRRRPALGEIVLIRPTLPFRTNAHPGSSLLPRIVVRTEN